jgi:predicted ATP-grasp superfamily ATP-dependent carboligase
MKAILTFARGWNALAAARSLGSRDIQIIAGDEYRFSPASFSKYTVDHFLYPNPDDDPDGFLDTLEQVIRRHRDEGTDDGEQFVLMPFHKESFLIAQHRERFEPLIHFALPTIEQILQVDDKGTLARLCQQRGTPIPQTAVVDSREEFIAAAKDFPYDAFVKVPRSAAAVGVKHVGDAAQALAAFDDFTKRYSLTPGSLPLLQQGVPGDDYCTTFLFDHGQCRASMTYHNLLTYPVKSGTGVMRETVDCPAMTATGEQLLGSLGWHGVAEVDFRWTGGDAVPLLIEVNPRFWGGLPQSVASGWDYPYLLYRLAVDGQVDAVAPHASDVKTETPVVSVLAMLSEIAHDDLRLNCLKEAYHECLKDQAAGHRLKGVQDFFKSLTAGIDVRDRYRHAHKLLTDNAHAVSDVWSWHDPAPALGVLYPLAVFMKHGRVNTELLVN